MGSRTTGARVGQAIFALFGLVLLGLALKVGWEVLGRGELWVAGLIAIGLGGGGIVFLLSATKVRADETEVGAGVVIDFHMRAAAVWIIALMAYTAVSAVALAIVERDPLYLLMALPALVVLVTRLLVFEVLGESQRQAERERERRGKQG